MQSLIIQHHNISLTIPTRSLLQDRIASLTQMESKVVRAKLTNHKPSLKLWTNQVRTEMAGEQKTQNYDVSSLIGDGSSVGVVSSSPLVSAMMVSIVLNLVNFSILYYQVKFINQLSPVMQTNFIEKKLCIRKNRRRP